MKIILLRHGESEWNLENRFTGWKDIKLSKNGELEALKAGEKILQANIKINKVFCSILERAKMTSEIVCKKIKYPSHKIIFDWRLNERHYGALEGKIKSETAKQYGEEKVKIWRRSFDTPPPQLNFNDERHPRRIEKFKDINAELPVGESLKDVIERIQPFWSNFKSLLQADHNYLIVGHSNSLRAIVKLLENLDNNQITEVEIPTGEPLIYELSKMMKIIDKQYLINERELISKQNKIINQGKIK